MVSNKEIKDEFHKEYGVISNCRYVLGQMAKYRRPLLYYLAAASFAGSVTFYIWSFIGKLVIDMIEEQSAGGGDITPLLFMTAAAFAADLALKWLNSKSTLQLSAGYEYVQLMTTKERIAKTLSMVYETMESPDMLDRLEKAKRATSGYAGMYALMTSLQSAGIQIVSIITAVAIMVTFSPLVVPLIAALGIVQFLYFDYIRKKDKEVMWDSIAPYWRKIDYMEEITSNFAYAKDIRLFGMKKFIAAKHREVNNIEYEHWKQSRQLWIYNSVFAHGISLVRQVIIISWLIFSFSKGDISIGSCTFYFAGAESLSGAMSKILADIGSLRENSAKFDDHRSFMDIPIDEKKGSPIPKAEGYTFEFENVSFKYKGQESYALKNVNITLKAGEKLAVVGLNGAGKSTFIKLLLRLYDVTEGRILMNGIDIREFDREEYYALFSPAFQDVVAFASPMSENVSMNPPENTDKARTEKMLRDAGLGDKLDSLEKGIDTELLKVFYEDGIDLSGGEKQKLALARALYKNAAVVVLDEPTAALDALAEYRLYQSFDNLIGGRTAVYISHRLSSTRFCDRVAMFRDGEMVETGSHDELMAKEGAYAEMFRIQAQYYIEDKDIFDIPEAVEGGAADNG